MVFRRDFAARFAGLFASIAALLLGGAVVSGCSSEDTAPAVATPSLSISRDRVGLGAPVDFTYQFDVTGAVPPGYRVLVHVVNADGDTIWIDDHDPPVPTAQWKAGQRIQYTRQRFLPVLPYTGEAAVRVGLYKTDDRLPLQGAEPSQRTYKVATLQLLPQSENVFLIFKSGWNAPEFTPDSSTEWQWTQKSGVINFKNPRKDVTLYLEMDARVDLFNPAQQVTLVVGGTPVRTLTAGSATPVLQRVPLTAAELGPGDMVELRIDVDRTFVPAQLPGGGNDTRELGVRIYHLFVEPK